MVELRVAPPPRTPQENRYGTNNRSSDYLAFLWGLLIIGAEQIGGSHRKIHHFATPSIMRLICHRKIALFATSPIGILFIEPGCGRAGPPLPSLRQVCHSIYREDTFNIRNFQAPHPPFLFVGLCPLPTRRGGRPCVARHAPPSAVPALTRPTISAIQSPNYPPKLAPGPGDFRARCH